MNINTAWPEGTNLGCEACSLNVITTKASTKALRVTLLQTLVNNKRLNALDLEPSDNCFCPIEVGIEGPGKGWLHGGHSMIDTCPKHNNQPGECLIEGWLSYDDEDGECMVHAVVALQLGW